jgi:hypothetical protein
VLLTKYLPKLEKKFIHIFCARIDYFDVHFATLHFTVSVCELNLPTLTTIIKSQIMRRGRGGACCTCRREERCTEGFGGES